MIDLVETTLLRLLEAEVEFSLRLRLYSAYFFSTTYLQLQQSTTAVNFGLKSTSGEVIPGRRFGSILSFRCQFSLPSESGCRILTSPRATSRNLMAKSPLSPVHWTPFHLIKQTMTSDRSIIRHRSRHSPSLHPQRRHSHRRRPPGASGKHQQT